MVYGNLVRRRNDAVNAWDVIDGRPGPDTERWLGAMAAGGCLVLGFRRRSPTGFFLSAAAGVLAWWAAGDRDERRHWRAPRTWRVVSPSRADARFDPLARVPRLASTPPTDPLPPPKPRT